MYDGFCHMLFVIVVSQNAWRAASARRGNRFFRYHLISNRMRNAHVSWRIVISKHEYIRINFESTSVTHEGERIGLHYRQDPLSPSPSCRSL